MCIRDRMTPATYRHRHLSTPDSEPKPVMRQVQENEAIREAL